MTPEHRFEELQILMPGTPRRILEFLASDHTVQPWENSHEERNLYADPVRDFFYKFRIDKTKLQRILNCCGEHGARWLRNRHYYWNLRHIENEAAEYGVAVEAAKEFRETHEGEAYVEAINNTVAEMAPDGEPLVQFNAHRAALILQCDRVLRSYGRYGSRSMIDCHKMLRSLVRKVEVDRRKRSPEEIIGVVPARSNFPNTVFADGYFGDGRRYIQEKDEQGNLVRQYKEPLYQPMVPQFVNRSLQEQHLMIQERIRQEKARKQRESKMKA